MKSFCLILVLPVAACAFSSIPADNFRIPQTTNDDDDDDDMVLRNNASPNSPWSNADMMAADASSPWRVALDIGREPLARMPFDWARSGCRMPLVIPTDFKAAGDDNARKRRGGDNDNNSNLVPRSGTTSFTGPDGAVVRPIVGERWELRRDRRTITLSYSVPERMERRDVYIDAGTELVLTGRVYTQEEMDRINAEYYEAREALWKAGGEIGDIYDRMSASKKWDEESKRWVQRHENENPFEIAQKQLAYWGAKAGQGRKLAQRPELNELSDRGSLPGVEGGVYVAKGGTVRAGSNGPVCGTWSAVPITGAPASYRS